MIKTIALLFVSNVFMTFAWYGHLKFRWLQHRTLLFVILAAWGMAFFEYCFQVPANRFGFTHGLSAYQLKVIQEVITLSVFVVFAWFILGERITWNYLVSFFFLAVAAYFAFGVRAAPPAL